MVIPEVPAEKKHVCSRCGRVLKKPSAIAAGIGDVCAARKAMGIPYRGRR